MKTIIAGGRDITDHKHLTDAVKSCPWSVDEVVCGGARGVDQLGAVYAYAMKKPIKHFPADWNTHGKAAGPIRNAQMAEYADALILIWDGKSRGSASMKREAEKRGLRVHELIV